MKRKSPRTASSLLFLTIAALVATSSQSQAQLLTYEGFDYSEGSVADRSGGTGWTGAWTAVGTAPATVQTTSLSYSTLETAGNKVYLSPTSNTSGASRTFANLDSGTVYMSFLGNLDEGIRFFGFRLFDGETERAFVGKRQGLSVWELTSPGASLGPTTTAVTLDTTFFFVLRIDFNASGSNERLRLYMNPTVGATEPGTASADIISASSFQINKLDLAAGFTSGTNTTARGWFDEIRIGTTYADVTPVPEPTTGVLIGAGIALLAILRRLKRS